jgi:hypothetical protein
MTHRFERTRRVGCRLAAAVLLLLCALPTAQAQRGGMGGGGRSRGPVIEPNVPYDGRFTYIRVKYDIPMGGGGFRGVDIKWSHDYPRGERHFAKIVSQLSTIRTWATGSAILGLDDPLLTKYPVAFLTEPGFWHPTESEVVALRNYLTKGGFIIFDDFAGEHWMNFEAQMRRVLPKLRPIELKLSHPLFDSFYKIKTLDYNHPYYRGYKSVFYGIFEDNDPKKRLMAVVNYNNDISEYWEFSDEGMFPMDASNEAYKIGINYIIYALTR